MHNANFRFLLNRNDFQYNYKVLWMVHFSFAQLDAKQQGWAWELASLSNNLYTSSTLTLSKVKTKNCTHCNQCVRALKQFMQTKLLKSNLFGGTKKSLPNVVKCEARHSTWVRFVFGPTYHKREKTWNTTWVVLRNQNALSQYQVSCVFCDKVNLSFTLQKTLKWTILKQSEPYKTISELY